MKSTAQEERLGKMDGGAQHPGSGRIWKFKRDGRIHEFLIEASTTEKHTYCIDKREFMEIRKEGLRVPPGLLPGMQITIQDLDLIAI